MRNYNMILSQNHRAHFDYKNNGNILVLGQVGTGKTRAHILPNIMEQDGISMVISDTKGELQAKTATLLKQKGYKIKSINLDTPVLSADKFNPFQYISTPEEILMVSSILVTELNGRLAYDPYWDNAAMLLLNAVTAFLVQECASKERTLANLRKLICANQAHSEELRYISPLDIIFDDLRKKSPNCFAVQQWDAFSTISGSEKTVSCILSVLLTKFAQFLTPDVELLTSKDTVHFEALGREKTALFISVSDVDRSKDKLASIFYSLLLNRLRTVADTEPDRGLPVHVHCFLDDFATNVVIPSFDNYISCLRSREISFTLVLQSERQLEKLYGPSAKTIIANCAYYLFLGSRDLECCYEISRRMNVPLDRVLYKAKDELFILSDAQKPIVDQIYDLTSHKDYPRLTDEVLYVAAVDPICK